MKTPTHKSITNEHTTYFNYENGIVSRLDGDSWTELLLNYPTECYVVNLLKIDEEPKAQDWTLPVIYPRKNVIGAWQGD